jgi:diguanylate cyclase (GGDEF)-like protein
VGAIDYITKPFRLPIVKARVHNHLLLKKRGDLLEERASQDRLSIPNRRSFNERLAEEWNRAKRHGASLALIMLDIDFFKAYNDHYGHPQGDACLQKVANALKAVPRRASDFLARYGGEEFAAILADTSLDEAANMAEKIRSRVEELAIPHDYSKVAPYVTISLGVAVRVPGDNDSVADLVKDADDALVHRAKPAGRNRVAW